MRKFYMTDKLSPKLCEDNPSILFIFGDNLIGKGCGGQACIRYCDNSMGIPTKRLPSMSEGSFFGDLDDEWEAIMTSLRILSERFKSGEDVCFGKQKLGTGLARMDIKSPLHFKLMVLAIEKMVEKYGYEYEELI